MGVFQRTFFVSLQVRGRPVAAALPVPSGPRNSGQSARAGRAARRTAAERPDRSVHGPSMAHGGHATAPGRQKSVNLAAKLALFADHWKPRTVAQLNDYDVMVVKVQGEFVWHKHDETDDFFLVLAGELQIRLRDPHGRAQGRASCSSSRAATSTSPTRRRKRTSS